MEVGMQSHRLDTHRSIVTIISIFSFSFLNLEASTLCGDDHVASSLKTITESVNKAELLAQLDDKDSAVFLNARDSLVELAKIDEDLREELFNRVLKDSREQVSRSAYILASMGTQGIAYLSRAFEYHRETGDQESGTSILPTDTAAPIRGQIYGYDTEAERDAALSE